MMNRILIILAMLIATCSISIAQAPPKPKKVKVDGISFLMMYIDGDSFKMGGTDTDTRPEHTVTLSSYYISETLVTQKLWEAVMGSNPSSYSDIVPKISISWDMAQEFITKLNQKTGLKFRLPTEAEWEYAANGGKTGNIGTIGLNNSNDWSTMIVSRENADKTKSPNGLGIWYMLGNLWEWCQDWYDAYPNGDATNPTGPTSGTDKVMRGGSWMSESKYCNPKYRASRNPKVGHDDVGLRLALTYEPKKK
ncbi:MAG: formylglycine-generating enzyme family protein [Bacteroidales bacterium]|nr:formylglycine-generating enzyme family protein [Bacteroidales bacterium]